MSGSKVSDEGAIVQRRVFPPLGLASKGGHRPGARSSLHSGTLATSGGATGQNKYPDRLANLTEKGPFLARTQNRKGSFR